MAAPLESLDAAFAFLLRATAQASIIVLLILGARAVLGDRLSPTLRYALWSLLALPFAAPLLPGISLPLPELSLRVPSFGGPPASQSPAAPAPSGGLKWEVYYESLPGADAPSSPAPPPVNWWRPSAITWILGAGLLGLRVVVAHAGVVWRARRGATIGDSAVVALLEQCCRTVGVRRAPRLVACPSGTGPALLGVLRPRLLLPADAPQRLTPAELRFIFLHELVHLRRDDVLGEWLLTLVQVVHWFNPIVWLAAGRCRADREIACDAAVLALTDESARTDYGRTILKLAADLPHRPRLAAAAVGILQSQSPLERRLRMIANAPSLRSSRWPPAIVAVVALMLVVCTNAQTPQQKDTPEAAPETAPNARPSASEPASKPAARAANSATGPAKGDEPNIPYQDVLKFPDEWRDVSVRDRTVAEENRDGPKNAAVRAQLDRVLPEINFDALPLTDAIDHFRDVTGVNIFINWKALEAAGVERNTPVSARMRDIRFRKALAIVLDTVAAPEKPLGFNIDDGVITVSTADDLDRDSVVRVYDVRDLIAAVPDYDPPPANEPPAAPAPREPAAEWAKIDADHARPVEQDEAVRRLTNLLRETVEPAAWGKSANVRELQGQLIVTAPPRMHGPIVQVLEHLRQARGVQVSLETRLIAIDEPLLDALPAALRGKVAGQLRLAKDPIPLGDAPGPGPGEGDDPPGAAAGVYLSAADLDQFLRAVQATGHAAVISAPRITLFNGQAAYVIVGNQRAYVADYTVLKQPNGQTKYEPVFGTATAGIMLWARATASADRKHATLSLHPRFTQLAGMEEVPWHQQAAAGKDAQDLTVQRPDILVSELRLTTSVPNGQTLLLGGLKGHFPAEGEKVDAGAPLRNVIMLVKPTLIIRREVVRKEFPLPNDH